MDNYHTYFLWMTEIMQISYDMNDISCNFEKKKKEKNICNAFKQNYGKVWEWKIHTLPLKYIIHKCGLVHKNTKNLMKQY